MTLGATTRHARAFATAKKVRGEGHWQPAKKTDHGPVILDGEKFDTPHAAKMRARKIIMRQLKEREE